ncbi:MAG: cobalt-precorrin-7 (C(5))-methyltransferase, partial [Candidatus Weimeria sp.]
GNDCRRAAVLFSGDTGFYSGAAKFLERIHIVSGSKKQKKETEKEMPSANLSKAYEVEVFPGISSVQALSAAAHLPYNDAAICSFHGRDLNLSQIRETVENNRISYFLFSGKEDAEKTIKALEDREVKVYTGIDFGSKNQQVVSGTDKLPEGKLYIMVVENLCVDL